MIFGKKLKELRKHHKITQEQLAKIINVERSSIGKYESTDTLPSRETLIKIAQYFNVSTDFLLGNENNPETTHFSKATSQQYETINEQEKTLLETFRSTTELGRQRIIQSALNIYDDLEKKNSEKNTRNLG